MKTFNRYNIFITITTIIITTMPGDDIMVTNLGSSWFPVGTVIITTTIITASIAAIIIEGRGCRDFELHLKQGLPGPCFFHIGAIR